MDIWKVLGIEPTKDKEELKNIYRTKLSTVNPEDDAEGFMRLREAYEEAVRLADMDDNISDDKNETPLLSDIRVLYNDFYSRISTDAWRELLDRDEFISLDSAEDSFKTLMVFLMDNFYVPQDIWKIINEYFDIIVRKKELSEIYPADFIEYIINNAKYPDVLNYYLLEGNEEEFDDYIAKYYGLDTAIRRRDIEKQKNYFNELEELDVYHPYFEICKAKHKIQLMYTNSEDDSEESFATKYKDQLKEIQDSVVDLSEELSQDFFIAITCGEIGMLREDYELAEIYIDKALSIYPDNYIAKCKQADLKFYTKDYEKSRDIYLELLKINHYDNNVRAGMLKANYALIEQFKKKIDDNPEDNKTRMEMAWSYYQSYQFIEATKILDEFEPDKESVCEYNNVKGRSFLCLSDYEHALACFEIWKSEIEKISEDDDSEESIKKKKRYEYVNFLIADCYLKTKRYEEAKKYLDIALLKEHDEIILSYEAKCQLEFEIENYEECIKVCEKLVERDSSSYIAYNFLSKANYELGYYQDAINASERAIRIYPYVAEPYTLQIKVFKAAGQIEAAKNVIERYKSFEIESDKIDYWEARLLETEGKHEEVVKLISATIERGNPDDSDMDEYCELYIILAYNYERLEENDKAYELYEKALELEPNHHIAYGRLGIIQKNKGNYNDAIDKLNKQLDINPHPFYFVHRGLIHQYLLNYKSALEDYEEALKYEPDNTFCLMRIGVIYERHREFDKALDYFDRALALFQDTEDDREDKALVYTFKARTLQCMNRFEESKVVYDSYFEEFDLNADVAYDYSELLIRMNNLEAATGILQKCIDTLEYSDDVHMCMRQLCTLYGLEGYVDKANEVFLYAISKKSDDCRTYSVMAEVFKDNELWDEAKKLYEKAIQYDTGNNNYYSALIETILNKKSFFKPNISEYIAKAKIKDEDMKTPLQHIKMSRLYRLMKNTKDALEMADKALKMRRCTGCFYGKCHEALYAKALIYEHLKDYEMARMCYREAIRVCGHNALYEERLKRIENK